jgi:hypothetical protein
LLLNLNNTVTLLDNWEHFDPEGARVQRFLRAFADHPQDDSRRQDAERSLSNLPQMIQSRLRQMVDVYQH